MFFSELFFLAAPFLWLYVSLFFVKDASGPKLIIRSAGIVIVCFLLSYLMLVKASAVMGGRWGWGEVGYYGWLMTGFLTVFFVFKKILLLGLKKWIPGSENLGRTVFMRLVYYAILFVVGVPFFLAMTSVHRLKVCDVFTPTTALNLAYEDVAWKTADGVVIKGWFVPAVSDKAVLIAHGLGANKSNFIRTVQLWHGLGFNVLIFDFRGHGASDGHTVSFGYRERLDVIGGWDYLTQVRKFLPVRITGYGVSFGGAAMLHAAREIKGFHQIIIDSSFASLDTMADNIVAGEPMIPSYLRQASKEIGLFFIRWDVGFDIREKSPENIVADLTGTPILFIHGKGDLLIPSSHAQRLYARSGEPKRIVIFNTHGHFATLNDPSYAAIIASFIQ